MREVDKQAFLSLDLSVSLLILYSLSLSISLCHSFSLSLGLSDSLPLSLFVCFLSPSLPVSFFLFASVILVLTHIAGDRGQTQCPGCFESTRRGEKNAALSQPRQPSRFWLRGPRLIRPSLPFHRLPPLCCVPKSRPLKRALPPACLLWDPSMEL